MKKNDLTILILSVIVRHHKGLGCEVICDGYQCENCLFTAEDIVNLLENNNIYMEEL